MSYNGYANYKTWDCAMFLGLNPYYHLLCTYRSQESNPTYHGFLEFAQLDADATPDGVAWNAPVLDIAALDAVVLDTE